MKPHNESMLLQTPFHSRVAAACETNKWDNWKGYTTPNSYTELEQEYFAIRNATGVFDLSPMTKYRITGPDSEAFLNRLLTRDISKLRIGRVAYAVWCDEAGQVMDDGTVFHLAENDYRLCSYTRMMDWMMWSAMGFDVHIEDETDRVAALAIQGPTSCSVLEALGLAEVSSLTPFGIREYSFKQQTLIVSRTGFTGDLGYELWIDPEHAESLWDKLFSEGKNFGVRAIGGAALELARIEAGFLQAGIDFVPAEEAIRKDRTRSPFELGLGWLVNFDKPVFNGRRALLEEQRQGSKYRFAYLDVEGNKPAEHSFIVKGGKEVGIVTSAAWCPTAKSNIAFAQLDARFGEVGEQLLAEIYYQRELKWTKVMAKCTVIENVVFNPPRRRQTPAAKF